MTAFALRAMRLTLDKVVLVSLAAWHQKPVVRKNDV
jgi:hypothetical protein